MPFSLRTVPDLQTQAPLSLRISLVLGSHCGRSGVTQLFDGILAVADAVSSPGSPLNLVLASGTVM